jgi:hypothetical protein
MIKDPPHKLQTYKGKIKKEEKLFKLAMHSNVT